MLLVEGQKVSHRDNQADFFSRIGREDLKTVLTPHRPWVLYSTEFYLEGFGLPGNGGLGILMGDFIYQAHKLGLPVVGVALGYPERWVQKIGQDFTVEDQLLPIDLEQAGLPRRRLPSGITIRSNGDAIALQAHQAVNGMPLYTLSEPGLRNVYADKPDSDHRLYQQICLGFGGPQLTRALGLDPAVQHLNEAAVFGVGLSQLDWLIQQGRNLPEALQLARANNLFSNHTLEPAASGVIDQRQINEYILKNVATEQVKSWLQGLPKDGSGKLNLGLLSMELAGRLNGVSILHATIASDSYRMFDGSAAQFAAVTNGIALERWVAPKLYQFYKSAGIYDEWDLPTDGYKVAVANSDEERLRKIKVSLRQELREYLTVRQDQYGEGVKIPDTALIACWAKRLHSYKRPELLLTDTDRLKRILVVNNMHIIIAGKPHSTDSPMKSRLRGMLSRIDSDEALKKRVHYIQNYDEALAKKLIPGVDIWCNTPVVGKEACGTSWEKAIANLGILVSTEDGGVADVKPAHYLRLEGATSEEEIRSLYDNLEKAAKILRGSDQLWGAQVKTQLGAYAATLSGARMLRDYLNLIPRRTQPVAYPFYALAA